MIKRVPQPLPAGTKLDGKVVAVTGASGRLGGALARELASAGARVVLCARRPQPLLRLARQLGAGRALAVPCDVSSEKDCLAFARRVEKAFGRLDGLINGAAVLEKGPLLELDAARLRKALQINVAGALLMTRAAAPLLAAGSVINVTSGAGLAPQAGWAAYSISKTALDMLTRIQALELAGRPRVNAVDPGLVPKGALPRATVRLFLHLLSPDSAPVNGCYYAVEETDARSREGRAVYRYL